MFSPSARSLQLVHKFAAAAPGADILRRALAHEPMAAIGTDVLVAGAIVHGLALAGLATTTDCCARSCGRDAEDATTRRLVRRGGQLDGGCQAPVMTVGLHGELRERVRHALAQRGFAHADRRQMARHAGGDRGGDSGRIGDRATPLAAPFAPPSKAITSKIEPVVRIDLSAVHHPRTVHASPAGPHAR